MHCPACGIAVVEAARFCHKCGEPLTPDAESNLAGQAGQTGQANRLREAVAQRQSQSGPDEEQELWSGAFSPRAMIGNWAASGAMTAVLLAVWIVWQPAVAWWLVMLGALVVAWGYQLGVLAYRRMSEQYHLTTRRFLHKSGVFFRTTDRIEVLDMDDITVEQGFIERFTGVGTVRITSSDCTHPDLRLRGIEDVQEVARIFDDARLAERRRRSLHVERI